MPCAANVFGAEEGNEDVYNGSGCRDVVGAVLGGCNGEQQQQQHDEEDQPGEAAVSGSSHNMMLLPGLLFSAANTHHC